MPGLTFKERKMEASVSSRNFTVWCSVSQLRSKKVQSFGAGNMSTFRDTAKVMKELGLKQVSLHPLNDMAVTTASQFSRASMNALSRRLIDLQAVPEIRANHDLRDQLEYNLYHAGLMTKEEQAQLGMVEILTRHYLHEAYNKRPTLGTDERLADFRARHDWWLEKHAYFSTLQDKFRELSIAKWDPDYADMDGAKARALMGTKQHQTQMDFYRYVQMETYRQVREGLRFA